MELSDDVTQWVNGKRQANRILASTAFL